VLAGCAVPASNAGGYDLRLWKNNPDNIFEETQAATTAALADAPTLARGRRPQCAIWVATSRCLRTAGPGAPQLRSSVRGRPLPVAP
jgi:hypothetical protein